MKEIKRAKFWEDIEEELEEDNRVYLLCVDLGFPYLNNLQKKFPDRVINTGLIEQSAIGIAVGLALSGKKVYVYSTSTFLIYRAFEQIRNDIIYQGIKNVILVGTAGKQYNFLGYTHIPKNKEEVKILKILTKNPNYIRLI